MENLESQTLGKYRLLKEIGRGMTGTVYLGRDRSTNRDVAVKVAHFKPGDTSAPWTSAATCSSTKPAPPRLLKHPNIVGVYDTGEEDEIFYIAMEYVPGGQTLDNVCTPGNLLPIDEAVTDRHQVRARAGLCAPQRRGPPRPEAAQFLLTSETRSRSETLVWRSSPAKTPRTRSNPYPAHPCTCHPSRFLVRRCRLSRTCLPWGSHVRAANG